MNTVTFNKTSNNPFEGKEAMLALFSNNNGTITTGMIDNAFKECTTLEDKQLFYSILFSVGDITARQHNIFHKVKKDSGGNSNRLAFNTILKWMWKNQREQFIKFLNAQLFNEYTCFDSLLINRVQTTKEHNKNVVVAVYNMLEDSEYRTALATYFYKILKGTNEFDKAMIAKFLTLPRLSPRKNHKQMLDETTKVMQSRAQFLVELSTLMNWEYQYHGSYANFKGYRAWRKPYNGNLESVLFSTKVIAYLTKEEFIKWVDALPADARKRTYNRIKDTEKYPNLMGWFHEWEEFKTKKQQEERDLTEKVRQGTATEDEVRELKKVQKQAKVTTGAVKFEEIYDQIVSGQVDKLKVESFMNKVNLPYNSLVIIDGSGSMQGKPFAFASFIASVCLVKNPDDTARNLIGIFDDSTYWYTGIDRKLDNSRNSYIRRRAIPITKRPFVDPHLSFCDNFYNISQFLFAAAQWGCTYINTIIEDLHRASIACPEVIDEIKRYPVWTIISDGEWNNLPSPKASVEEMLNACQKYFGFKPFIVAIDIDKWGGKTGERFNSNRFADVENMIYINSNVAQIEQFLTNFKDMDRIDIYAPLLAMSRSDRYELVRANVIE